MNTKRPALAYPVVLPGRGHWRELGWRKAKGEGHEDGLQSKVGWRTIKFGEYISKDEAIAMLTALERNMPDLAQQLCAMPDTSKRRHFTTLDLS
jgi:hypothetical protein